METEVTQRGIFKLLWLTSLYWSFPEQLNFPCLGWIKEFYSILFYSIMPISSRSTLGNKPENHLAFFGLAKSEFMWVTECFWFFLVGYKISLLNSSTCIWREIKSSKKWEYADKILFIRIGSNHTSNWMNVNLIFPPAVGYNSIINITTRTANSVSRLL